MHRKALVEALVESRPIGAGWEYASVPAHFFQCMWLLRTYPMLIFFSRLSFFFLGAGFSVSSLSELGTRHYVAAPRPDPGHQRPATAAAASMDRTAHGEGAT